MVKNDEEEDEDSAEPEETVYDNKARKTTHSSNPLEQLRALLDTDPKALSRAEQVIRRTVVGARARRDLRRQVINDLVSLELSDTEVKLAILTNPLYVPLLDHKSSRKANEQLQDEIHQVRDQRANEGSAAALRDYKRTLKRAMAEAVRALPSQKGSHFRSHLDVVIALSKDIAVLEGAIQQKAGQVPKPAGTMAGGPVAKTASPGAIAQAPSPALGTGIGDVSADIGKLEEEYEVDDEAENDFEDV